MTSQANEIPPSGLQSIPILNTPDPQAAPSKTIRVLHLINGEHFSGAERVQDLLAMAMPPFGYEIGFACVKPAKFPEVRQSRNCTLFETRMKTKLDIRCAGQVARIAREHNYRVIHAHTPRTLMLGRLVAKKLKRPLVYHVHSPVGRDSERGMANRLNTLIETWCLKGVDRMICVSKSLAKYMEELGHHPEKIRVVPNGVEVIGDLPSRPAPVRPWVVGTMALFRPRKGTEVLLEALAILKDKNIDVRMRAVGPFETPEYETDVKSRAIQLGVSDMIEWTGFQTDVNHQLRQMDLFVLPSLYGEGLPMVVLEAMANAVPVIASRVEGIPEAVRDGMDGLIFEPGDAEDLARQIASLVGDGPQWKSMSTHAIEHQQTELSDISMARGVARVYDELIHPTKNG